MTPFWMSALLDLPTEDFEQTAAFWSEVTGWPESPRRGDEGEFGTLLPADGDGYLKVQRITDGGPRIHLDLHVEDPRKAADAASALGARELADQGYVVLRSPGGLTFCYVDHPASRTPGPVRRPDGSSSRVDQVCLDLPREIHEQETSFWSAILDTRPTEPFPRSEFSLISPEWSPIRVLVQRLEEPSGPARARLDAAVTHRAAEAERHRRLGAQSVREETWWTVLADPAGSTYCLTDRTPE